MKALLIGCGKMGSLIARSLSKNPSVRELSIVDSSVKSYRMDKGISYYPALTNDLILRSDAVFIATPANTHAQFLKQLMQKGCQNIYVEKPAVVNSLEFAQVKALQCGQRIVTGYILRQSPPMHALKEHYQKLLQTGYQLKHCSVTYEKYLPFEAEARTQEDLGVFEEIVHIWDLLFNYLEMNRASRKLTGCELTMDPQRSDRTLCAELSYELNFEPSCDGNRTTSGALVEIHSSFTAPQRKRKFLFEFQSPRGSQYKMILSFDNADELDHLTISGSDGQVFYEENYPSLQKLDHQINEVLQYFKTGDLQDLAPFEESDIINNLLTEAADTQASTSFCQK